MGVDRNEGQHDIISKINVLYMEEASLPALPFFCKESNRGTQTMRVVET